MLQSERDFPQQHLQLIKHSQREMLSRSSREQNSSSTQVLHIWMLISDRQKDYGQELMKWAVELLQSNFDNVPLALDTSNVAAIEAGISVYNRSKGKPIVNSADAAGRIGYVDVAAANDAIVIALCNGEGIAKDNDERMMYMQTLMERGMEQGMDVENDMWFDPLFLVIKGMQDKQMEVLDFIKMISDMGHEDAPVVFPITPTVCRNISVRSWTPLW